MNTAQASNVRESSPIKRAQVFPEAFVSFLHVFGAAAVGFQVQDAVVGVRCMDIRPELVGHIDHEQREVRCIRDPGWGDA